MASEQFVSHTQNREDVVLNRVFGTMPQGRYVEVGANDPRVDSITYGFYRRGWSGLEIEANPAFAEAFRQSRPRDTFLQAAITDSDEPTITFHVIPDTGLSTLVDSVSAGHASDGWTIVDQTVPTARLGATIQEAGLEAEDIHFLVIDTEGSELQVLRSIDLRAIRPWVLIVEATAPTSTVQTHQAWEPLVLGSGYQFCLFDGLSRFYVADERAAELKEQLSYPACVLDNFIPYDEYRLLSERDELEKSLVEARERIDALEKTLSWRLTKPLRAVRGLRLRS
jgi:FkbM family methyltransferase